MANNVVLEYEKQWSYWLTLKVSDGTNSDTILAKIRVKNVSKPKVRIWLEDDGPLYGYDAANLMHPSIGSAIIRLVATVHNLPAGKIPTGCTWKTGDNSFSETYVAGYCDAAPGPPTSAGPVTYSVDIGWDGGRAAVDTYTVNWAP